MSAREFKSLSETEAADIIAGLRDADIFCHASPDGDTLGCALALRAVMAANGAHAEIKCCDPVPEYLRFLIEIDAKSAAQSAVQSDAQSAVDDRPRDGVARIAVDVSSPAQLGSFAKLCGSFSLMIDHHGRGEVFADNVVEADAAACGEIVLRVVEILRDRHGFSLPVEAADYLYAAVSSDTGSFRFANTTPETHMIAARLHKMGAHTVPIAHNLHAVRTPRQLAAKCCGLSHMRLLLDDKLAITFASIDDMQNGGFLPADFSESDEMRAVAGVLVGVSLREVEHGVWRVSTRANVPVDCAAVCAVFGGGGHLGAAGCTIRADSPDSAISAIAEQFALEIDKYEAQNAQNAPNSQNACETPITCEKSATGAGSAE